MALSLVGLQRIPETDMNSETHLAKFMATRKVTVWASVDRVEKVDRY